MKIEFTHNEIIFAKKALQEWSCGKLLSIPPDILTILLKLENAEKGGYIMFQEVFNNILSNLEYDNINYDVVTECGKTVIKIKCENGKIGKIIFDDTEENNDCL